MGQLEEWANKYNEITNENNRMIIRFKTEVTSMDEIGFYLFRTTKTLICNSHLLND